MFSDPLTEKLAAFVRSIGIDVRAATLTEPTFLPGLQIDCGALLIDEARLIYPGDILHEAGHIAVSDPATRATAPVSTDPGEEMAASAWSYAAARKLGIDPAIVFHAGFKGGGPSMVENFNAGRYIGVPMLHWFGMAVEPRQAASLDPYPHMLRWVR
ncbi:MAG: hypothetical protein E6G97_01320 [Alphaproteobacteria bacterium]|nr:MAG: hypothetical protein E6G97_01320 [Alphaproteobacteria bacterium]